jgi:hypothetical protein
MQLMAWRHQINNGVIHWLCGLIVLCSGCVTQIHPPVCLRNAHSGFVFWPVPCRAGDSINIGDDTVTLITMSSQERKVIAKLRNNKIGQFFAWGVRLEELEEKLNEAQRAHANLKEFVRIRVDIPPSWSTTLTFDDDIVRKMGYDKGFQTPASKYQPTFLIAAHEQSVYYMLYYVLDEWPGRISFSIKHGEVHLIVDEFRMEDAYHAEGLF